MAHCTFRLVQSSAVFGPGQTGDQNEQSYRNGQDQQRDFRHLHDCILTDVFARQPISSVAIFTSTANLAGIATGVAILSIAAALM
jgi:hypothetical protein